jgi:sec-independent protein translocase protein TatC
VPRIEEDTGNTPPVLQEVESGNPDDELDRDRPMPVEEHLAELRWRLGLSIAVWALVSGLAYVFYSRHFLEAIRDLAGEDFRFIYTQPTEAFFAFLNMSMVVGLFVTLPFLVCQAVLFVSPGLTRGERRWVLRMVPFSILLFAGGGAFAWYVALPAMWRFFLGFQGEAVVAMWTIGHVVGFVVTMVVLCGLLFQMPLVLLFASLIGLVHSSTLRKHRRVAIFAAFVVAAVATPTPDAVTAAVVAIPIVLLFEVSLLLMRLIGR